MPSNDAVVTVRTQTTPNLSSLVVVIDGKPDVELILMPVTDGTSTPLTL